MKITKVAHNQFFPVPAGLNKKANFRQKKEFNRLNESPLYILPELNVKCMLLSCINYLN